MDGMCMTMGCGFDSGANTMVALWFNKFYSDGPASYFGLLVLIFALAVLSEALRLWSVRAYRKYVVTYDKHILRSGWEKFSGRAVRALIHVLLVLVLYLVMLAIMSYNVGIFLVALAGFGVGFLLFTEDHHPKPEVVACCDGTVNINDGEEEETHQLLDPNACH